MIRTLFNENPTMSLRTAAVQIGLHHTTLWNFLRRNLKLYRYKLQMHQQISDEDKLVRVNFAQCCRNELTNDSEFFKRFVFSDECKFSLFGFVNKQNCQVWGLKHRGEEY